VPAPIRPQLGHCGIYVRDVGKMVDFYTRVVGLVLSDRGMGRGGGELAFLTGSSAHHHQFVLVSGRAPQGVTTVNQLSFKVADLDSLKAVWRRAREKGIGEFRRVSHGNALSLYFTDPEGNTIEIYVDTPWYVPQPYSVPIDLDLPNEEILAATEKQCRETRGFLSLASWRAKIAERLSSS
jgi:catechol 2,3-dioxygenase